MSRRSKNNISFEDIANVIIGMAFGVMLASLVMPKRIKEIPVPTVVEKEVIDSIYIVRDSIIYKTKYIREIQHDTIEKVYALDDSTTLKLFYKLVSE